MKEKKISKLIIERSPRSFHQQPQKYFTIILIIITLMMLFFFPVSSASGIPETREEECAALIHKMINGLPGENGEYIKSKSMSIYRGKSLFDYMNGGAPAYLDLGFLCLGVTEYWTIRDIVMMEIYCFGNQKSAKEMYNDEAGNTHRQLAIGQHGVYSGSYVSFYLQNYFVKLTRHLKSGERLVEENVQKNKLGNHLIRLARDAEKSIKNIMGVGMKHSGSVLMAAADTKVQDKNDLVLIGASYARDWHLDRLSGMKLINKGVDGDQSHEMLARFDRDVIALKPKGVVIWGFINDIHRSKRERMEKTVQRVKDSYIKMVALSRDNGIVPVLATEVTIRPKDSIMETVAGWVGWLRGKQGYQEYVNEQVLELNQWLKSLAEEKKIKIIDLQPLIADDENMRKKEYAKEDGTHISKAGYAVITEYTRKRLGNYF